MMHGISANKGRLLQLGLSNIMLIPRAGTIAASAALVLLLLQESTGAFELASGYFLRGYANWEIMRRASASTCSAHGSTCAAKPFPLPSSQSHFRRSFARIRKVLRDTEP